MLKSVRLSDPPKLHEASDLTHSWKIAGSDKHRNIGLIAQRDRHDTMIASESPIVALLRCVGLFSSLSNDQLVRISAQFLRREVHRGEMITIEGAPAEAIYVVARGSFKRFKTSLRGREQILQLLVRADFLGEISVLDGAGDFATTEALAESVVYGLPRSRCVSLVKDSPEFVRSFNQCLASRVRQTTNLVESLSFHHTRERLASFILAQSFAVNPPHLTHSDIASVVGTSREVVTRELRQLHCEGAISVNHGAISIVDSDALRDLGGWSKDAA
jgi:CRP/FNR family transcriptional regulator, cyclic AMP receptor protein